MDLWISLDNFGQAYVPNMPASWKVATQQQLLANIPMQQGYLTATDRMRTEIGVTRGQELSCRFFPT